MRNDSRGLPDICREVFTPVNQDVGESIKYIKLSANALVSFCRNAIDSHPDKEVKRWFAMAATAFEEGSMWATKALTYEGFAERVTKKQADHGAKYNNPNKLEK